LTGWVGTLFVYGTLPEGRTLLLVGRANFAAIPIAVTSAYLFTAELAGRPRRWIRWLWLETAALSAVSALTSLIDASESVRFGQHITAYGLLWPVYVAHVVVCVAAAVAVSFGRSPHLRDAVQRQLRLVGSGILATGVVAVWTNIVLPTWFSDFRFVNAGALSTVLLLGAITYAVSTARLFNVRVIVKATFVYTVGISLALAAYGATVKFLADLIPFGDVAEWHYAAAAIALIVNATTGDVIKKWLERLVDRLTAPKKATPGRIVGS